MPNTKDARRRFESLTEEDKSRILEMHFANVPRKQICEDMNITLYFYEVMTEGIEHNRHINVPIERHEEFLDYAKRARRISRAMRRYSGYIVIPKGYHWDHKVSLTDCFLADVPVHVAGDLPNLELIPAKENLEKAHLSSITVEELYRLRGLPPESIILPTTTMTTEKLK